MGTDSVGIELERERGMISVYLSLGSNIGDKKAYLEAALDRLSTAKQPLQLFLHFMKQPHGVRRTKMIFEHLLSIRDRIGCSAIIDEQEIEKDLQRVRHEHWGPRTIDIDILFMVVYRN